MENNCMTKKVLCTFALILIAATLFSTFAFAAEPRASAYIANRSASITAQGGGTIKITFTITATGTMTMLGAQTIDLYDSDGYVTTFRYTNPTYAHMMGYSDYYYGNSITYDGTSGETYYAVVSFYAGNSSGSDAKLYTTYSVTA